MAKLLGSYIDDRRKSIWKFLTIRIQEWQTTAYSLALFGSTLFVMFWVSVFLYTSFYFTYLPQESVAWPIYFNYDSCIDKPGLCSNPSAVVGVNDPSRGSVLVRGQKYRVVVDMDMPESPTNQRIGMFLVTLRMKSHNGDVLRQSARSAMLRYKSPLLQTLSTVLFAPLLVYGLREEKQTVEAELFSEYEEDPVTPVSEVHVELASRHVEVYSARLRVHAVFSGLRHLLYHYPLTSAVAGVGVCMAFLSAIVVFSWYQFSEPTFSAQVQVKPMPNGNAPMAPMDETSGVSSEKRPEPPLEVVPDDTGSREVTIRSDQVDLTTQEPDSDLQVTNESVGRVGASQAPGDESVLRQRIQTLGDPTITQGVL